MSSEKYILKTSRLGLRPHRLEDAAFMMVLNSDPEVVRYTGDEPFSNIEEAEVVIRRLDAQYEFDRTGRFVVELLDTGEPIGWCGLRWFPELQLHDLGYRFMKKYWGKGFATESSVACIEYARKELHVKHVFASVMAGNQSSLHVLQKLGFKPSTLEKPESSACELMFELKL